MKKNLTAIILVLFLASCSEQKEQDKSTNAKDILKAIHGDDYENHVKRQEEEKTKFEKEILNKIKSDAKQAIIEKNIVNNPDTVKQYLGLMITAMKERRTKDALLNAYSIMYIVNDPESKQYQQTLETSKKLSLMTVKRSKKIIPGIQ